MLCVVLLTKTQQQNVTVLQCKNVTVLQCITQRPQTPHGVGFFTVRFKLRFDGLWEHGVPKLGHLYGIAAPAASRSAFL
jgi:hypothetical protein